MNRYTLHQQPTTGAIEAIKQGWSWPATFFGCLWAFSRSMPGVAVAMLGAQFAVGLLIGAAAGPGNASTAEIVVRVAGFIYALVCGAIGNDWQRGSLARRGYIMQGELDAESNTAAIAAFSATSSAPAAVESAQPAASLAPISGELSQA